MYITFSYNEKGNFYIAERVIGKIVEDIVSAASAGVHITGSEVTIPKGSLIDIKLNISSPTEYDKIQFDPKSLMLKIKEIIIDLLGVQPHNITFVFSKQRSEV